MLAFLTTPLAKYIGLALVATFIATLAGSIVWTYDRTIKNEAKLEATNATLTQIIENQKKFEEDTKKLTDLANSISNDLNEEIKKKNQLGEDTSKYLDTTTIPDRPSSDIPKETIKRL